MNSRHGHFWVPFPDRGILDQNANSIYAEYWHENPNFRPLMLTSDIAMRINLFCHELFATTWLYYNLKGYDNVKVTTWNSCFSQREILGLAIWMIWWSQFKLPSCSNGYFPILLFADRWILDMAIFEYHFQIEGFFTKMPIPYMPNTIDMRIRILHHICWRQTLLLWE